MTYKISEGIEQLELNSWLKKAVKKYGPYKDKQVNYTDADLAPIVMCTILCGTEILIVKRAFGLADADGYWSTINGFIDELRPVAEIAKQELEEEAGLDIDIKHIKIAKSYTVTNNQEKRRYIVFPCLIALDKKPTITLNDENTDYKWIHRKDLERYETLDDLAYAIDKALELI